MLRQAVLMIALLQCASLADAAEYGHYDVGKIVTVSKAPSGQFSATINFSLLDQVLNDLSTHNHSYPARFDSVEDRQRQRAATDVVAISNQLETLLKTPSPNAELLLRATVLNGIGHNLDVFDAGEKAVADFT